MNRESLQNLIVFHYAKFHALKKLVHNGKRKPAGYPVVDF